MTLGENYYYGGLLRFDLSPKPAYLKIKELIKERWHTEEHLLSREGGEADFRGFYGGYDVEITVNGRSVAKDIAVSKLADNVFTITV